MPICLIIMDFCTPELYDSCMVYPIYQSSIEFCLDFGLGIVLGVILAKFCMTKPALYCILKICLFGGFGLSTIVYPSDKVEGGKFLYAGMCGLVCVSSTFEYLIILKVRYLRVLKAIFNWSCASYLFLAVVLCYRNTTQSALQKTEVALDAFIFRLIAAVIESSWFNFIAIFQYYFTRWALELQALTTSSQLQILRVEDFAQYQSSLIKSGVFVSCVLCTQAGALWVSGLQLNVIVVSYAVTFITLSRIVI